MEKFLSFWYEYPITDKDFFEQEEISAIIDRLRYRLAFFYMYEMPNKIDWKIFSQGMNGVIDTYKGTYPNDEAIANWIEVLTRIENLIDNLFTPRPPNM